MITAPTLRASVVQFEAAPDRPDLNLRTIRRLAIKAARDGARIVAFPEMCLIGYWHLRKQTPERLYELAQSEDGEHVQTIRKLAAELELGIGIGFLEVQADGRLFNSYSVCLPDGTVHTHRKLHAFEHEAISSGSEFTVFDTPWGVKAGILICWDNNLVENVRATALLGATVLIAPHQTGGTNSASPRGMKPLPAELWDNRAADPAAIEDAFRGGQRPWVAYAVAACPCPRQRHVHPFQQRCGPRRRRDPDGECDDHRSLRNDRGRDLGGGRSRGNGRSGL